MSTTAHATLGGQRTTGLQAVRPAMKVTEDPRRPMARSRFRSVSYDLDASVVVARIVADAGGSLTSDVLAESLGYSGTNNGAFLTRLANARLFGLVTGRTGSVSLSERGRAILVGGEPGAKARVDAFREVPLFRAVLDSRQGGALPGLSDLSEILENEFGETSSKAATVAAKLIDSAGQAGLLHRQPDGKVQFGASLTDFTDSPVNPPSRSSVRRIRSSRRLGRLRRGSEGGIVAPRDTDPMQTPTPDGPTGVWLPEDDSSPAKSRHSWRRAGAVAAAVACVAVVAVPVGLVVTSGGRSVSISDRHQKHNSHVNKAVHLGNGPAEHQVLQALSATTDSGNFNISYDLSETPGTSASESPCPSDSFSAGGVAATTPNQPCDEGQNDENTTVTGQGTIDTDPYAMAVSALVNGGLNVGVRVDSTNVWETDSNDNGLIPDPTDGSGQLLSGFASLVESTLGDRAGAIAMMGMASPTGYLDLEQQAVTGADEVGTSTIGGVPVTDYQVSVNPNLLLNLPGLSSDEITTIQAAIQVLDAQNYTSTTVSVAVDAAGYIRQASSVASFSDGGTVTLTGSFSNFGCAGTVLMPGQQATTPTTATCVSPDTTTTTTTTPPDPTTSTTVVPAVEPSPTDTTVPLPPPTVPSSTTVPPSTTTVPPVTTTTS
jgi:hypothetical protein